MRIAVFLPLLFLVACSSPRGGDPVFGVEAGSYAEAFDVVRDVLGEARYELDRVDARAGVITTRFRQTHGLAVPWERDQSTGRQELEDLFNHHGRRVRVTFEARGPQSPPAAPGAQASAIELAPDLRDVSGPIRGRVQVFLDRVYAPGRRVETESVRLTSRSLDPRLADRDMTPRHTVPLAEDPALAARIAARIRLLLED